METLLNLLAHLLVIAKAPVPGRSKTRLCPPCTPEQAAALAEAALADTLDAAAQTPCCSRTLVLDGPAGDWLPAGFRVTPQCKGGLGERLAAAFSAQREPTLLIGMDTPQVCPALLGEALDRVERPTNDAVFGPAEDGGYWAIGLREQQPGVFDGVPMSSSRTASCQLRRLADLGLEVGYLPTLRDVDHIADAHNVAAQRPQGEFARVLAEMETSLCPT